ncbi:hypothetical protein LMH73_020065 [Vibrio splendidus]|nr:hypothetical protein [Vibrio splendidus]MCC4880352.1 hypothetical protein [Vibrio splendidus]
MKLTAKITNRELSDVLSGLPVDMVFSDSIEDKFDHGLAVLLKENSKKTSVMKVYSYNKGNSSPLNEFRKLLGFEITDNFEFKMHMNRAKHLTEHSVTESVVLNKLVDAKNIMVRFGNNDSKGVELVQITKEYRDNGKSALNKYLVNNNDSTVVATKLDALIISLQAQCDQGVTLEPKRGITKADIQCVIVDDIIYERVCNCIPGTGMHAVQRSVFERSLMDASKANSIGLHS